ncbi:MAG: cation-transporting P-type ATPase, partial [Steroidobacteraceae bacterium]|nr:cation-transporting P-type ATPase [Deltaproteobacteria bacterium]
MKSILEERWHHLPEADVTDFLETASDRGLDTFEVGHRQEQFGLNTITQKKGKSPIILFLLQFNQPLVYILLAATVVTSLLREWVDAGVIFGVVLVNAVIGFIQEAKAVKAIEALAHSMTSTATVLR